MDDLNENVITIKYATKEKGKIRIFGEKFVENNQNNCKIIYTNKEKELEAFIKNNNFVKFI